MPKLQIDRFIRREDHVVWRVVDGKGIVLNLEDGAYFELNPVGLAVWQRCDGRTTVGEIVRRISEQFGEDHATVASDLMEFIADLRRRKIAEVLDEPLSTINPRTRQSAADYRGA